MNIKNHILAPAILSLIALSTACSGEIDDTGRGVAYAEQTVAGLSAQIVVRHSTAIDDIRLDRLLGELQIERETEIQEGHVDVSHHPLFEVSVVVPNGGSFVATLPTETVAELRALTWLVEDEARAVMVKERIDAPALP